MAEQKKGHGGSRKIGRNKTKCASYRALHIREKNKLKRIVGSNGKAMAIKYANKNNLIGFLAGLIKE